MISELEPNLWYNKPMRVYTRKTYESIQLEPPTSGTGTLEIVVIEAHDGIVKLGIVSPSATKVRLVGTKRDRKRRTKDEKSDRQT